jgi:hypothetical protein
MKARATVDPVSRAAPDRIEALFVHV